MSVKVLRAAFAFSDVHEVPVGRLALEGNVALFEPDPAFAGTRLALNPTWSAAASGLIRPRDARAFRGLHGVFADSLPDAWGEILLERRLRAAGVGLTGLTSLDRLALVGRRGRGALVYAPANAGLEVDVELDLDGLAIAASAVLEGGDSDVLAELERLGGSSGGARPKVQVALDDRGHARSDEGPLPPGYTSWIVKFRGSMDSFADIGPLEAAYAEAARRAGVELPRTRLIGTVRGPGYFATERFDRGPGGARFHMLSIAAMLDADWSIPALDYDGLLEAVRLATRDERAVLQLFRRMVFNVAAVNRDDHLKQHALLSGPDGRWRLSPAYDLTLAGGPGNEHYLAVNGQGRDITRRDILAVARRQSVAIGRANSIVDEVLATVESLPSIASEFGVTRATRAEIVAATGKQISLLR